jgi:hypothetical protein
MERSSDRGRLLILNCCKALIDIKTGVFSANAIFSSYCLKLHVPSYRRTGLLSISSRLRQHTTRIGMDDTASQGLERTSPQFLRVKWRNIPITLIDSVSETANPQWV